MRRASAPVLISIVTLVASPRAGPVPGEGSAWAGGEAPEFADAAQRTAIEVVLHGATG